MISSLYTAFLTGTYFQLPGVSFHLPFPVLPLSLTSLFPYSDPRSYSPKINFNLKVVEQAEAFVGFLRLLVNARSCRASGFFHSASLSLLFFAVRGCRLAGWPAAGRAEAGKHTEPCSLAARARKSNGAHLSSHRFSSLSPFDRFIISIAQIQERPIWAC